MPTERFSRRPARPLSARPARRLARIAVLILTVAVVGGLAAPGPERSTATGRAALPGQWPAADRPAVAAAATPVPAQDDDIPEPAIARAAERGLQEMRIARTPVSEWVAGAPDPTATASARTAVERAADESRDARDPLARTDAPPPAATPRVLKLRPGAAGGPPGAPTVTPLGHSTVLISLGGITVLADPNFLRHGEHARLLGGLAWPRQADPALDFDRLPPVDLVLLSSLREDRFDRTVRRMLPRETPIVAPTEARGALIAMGFSSVHGLNPGQSLRVEKGDAWLALTATPTRMRPVMLANLLPASTGSLLAFGGGDPPAERRIWISGDTRLDDALLKQLAEQVEGVDLALLHRGGSPSLGLIGLSLDAAEARRLVSRLRPFDAIALHVDDHDAGPPRFAGITLPAQAAGAPTPDATATDRLPGEPRVLPRGSTHPLERAERWASGPAVPSP